MSAGSQGELALFVLALLSMRISMVSSSDGYDISLSRGGALNNDITLNCRRTMLNGNGQPTPSGIVSNPHWYFNGSSYKNHSCTVNGEKDGSSFKLTLSPECEGFIQCGDESTLSLPKRLLAYPTLIDGNTPKTIRTMVNDDEIIPCGIRVSATGNFDISWLETYTQGGNKKFISDLGLPQTLTSDYGLNVTDIQDRENNQYICTATARTDHGELAHDLLKETLSGPPNNIDAVIYDEPQVNRFLMESEDGVGTTFKLQEISGTNNQYTWSKNDALLDSGMKGITISESPPSVTFTDHLQDGDVIIAEVVNQNIHGEEKRYTAHGFLFTLAPSSCTVSTITTSVTKTSTVMVYTTNQRVFGGTASGRANIAFVAFIFVAVLLTLLLSRFCTVLYNKLKRHDDNKLVIKVNGNKTICVDKSKMNNLPDFIQNIDYLLGVVSQSLSDSLNDDNKTKIQFIRSIILGWTLNPPDNNHQQLANRIRFDCSHMKGTSHKEPRLLTPNEVEENTESDPFSMLFPNLSQLYYNRSSSTEEP